MRCEWVSHLELQLEENPAAGTYGEKRPLHRDHVYSLGSMKQSNAPSTNTAVCALIPTIKSRPISNL